MSPAFKDLSNAIRMLSVDAVQRANSGHPGMPMGMADVATVLFKYYLRSSPKNPSWINRDRIILSAGHGSKLLYSLKSLIPKPFPALLCFVKKGSGKLLPSFNS